jgi:hypothetical protein
MRRFTGEIRHGAFAADSQPRWASHMGSLEGQRVRVDVWREAQDSSLDRPTYEQHGYYRAVILPTLAEEWGWADKDELHFRLKEKHIPVDLWVERRIGGELVMEPPSMAVLTIEQASAFLQAVLDQAAEANVPIPPPRRYY